MNASLSGHVSMYKQTQRLQESTVTLCFGHTRLRELRKASTEEGGLTGGFEIVHKKCYFQETGEKKVGEGKKKESGGWQGG